MRASGAEMTFKGLRSSTDENRRSVGHVADFANKQQYTDLVQLGEEF